MAQEEMPELRFSANEYAVLMKLMMVSDPWPLTSVERDRMEKMLNKEAVDRGYDDWVGAYHEWGLGGE